MNAASKPSPPSGRTYLEQHALPVYLRDVIQLVLSRRDDRPLDHIYEYFKSVSDGNNVISRDFKYINATPRNRASFVRNFQDSHGSMPGDERVTAEDYHQLLCLLCPDFSPSVVQAAARPLLVGQPAGDRHLPFSALSVATQAVFFYSEFFARVQGIFRELVAAADASSGRVAVGTLLELIWRRCFTASSSSSSSSSSTSSARAMASARKSWGEDSPVGGGAAARGAALEGARGGLENTRTPLSPLQSGGELISLPPWPLLEAAVLRFACLKQTAERDASPGGTLPMDTSDGLAPPQSCPIVWMEVSSVVGEWDVLKHESPKLHV